MRLPIASTDAPATETLIPAETAKILKMSESTGASRSPPHRRHNKRRHHLHLIPRTMARRIPLHQILIVAHRSCADARLRPVKAETHKGVPKVPATESPGQ